MCIRDRPYPAETTTEILLAQQLHTAADGIHRLHYLIIEYYQIDKDLSLIHILFSFIAIVLFRV